MNPRRPCWLRDARTMPSPLCTPKSTLLPMTPKPTTCFAAHIFPWATGIAAFQPAKKRSRSLPTTAAITCGWAGFTARRRTASNFFKAASLAGKVRNEFETAVRLDPNNVDARSDLGEFYLEAPGIVGGGRDKAEAQAQAWPHSIPPRPHYLNGRLAEKKKDSGSRRKGISRRHRSQSRQRFDLVQSGAVLPPPAALG